MSNCVKNKIERMSGVELLRIIAICMIVASHCLPYYGNSNELYYVNLNVATNSINVFLMIMIKYLGQIGNCIFIVIASYFLLERNFIKWKKIKMIITDSFVFSVAILIVALLLKVNLSGKEIIKQIFPITFQGCWFVGCYLFLYVIHPALNMIINACNQKKLLRISVVLFMLYSVISILQGGAGYYYNFLIGFIMIYFITAYFKLYLLNTAVNKKVNLWLIVITTIGLILLLVITDILGLKKVSFSNKMLKWNIFTNPIIIVLSLSIFNLFNSFKFKNNTINKLSCLTLYIYMLHENPVVRDNFKPWLFNKFINYNIWLSISLLFFITILFCIPVSLMYINVIKKYIYKISDWFFNMMTYIYLKLERKLLTIK